AGGETDRSQRDIKNNVTVIDGQGSVRCIYVYWAAPVIDGFTFSNCHAGELQSGGAIFFDDCMEQYPVVTNCIFKNNYAGYGGSSIFNSYSSPRITNCMFWNNTAFQCGAGVYNTGASSPFITNCSFSGNAAGWAGGAVHSDGAPNLPSIANSIFWNDTAGHNSPEISGATGGVTYSDVNQDGFTGNGNIRSDPKFVSPDIGNLHIRQDSPCIDAGSDSAFFLPVTDIDGDPRRVDGNGDGIARVDIGADEYVPGTAFGIWYVDGSVSASGTGTSWAQAFKTISAAISAASNGDEIWVKQGTNVIGSTVNLSKNISIYGGFAGTETLRNQRNWNTNVTTVDGVINNFQCFHVDGSSHNVTTIFDGLTLTRCGKSGTSGSQGGAIQLVSASSSIRSSASINNCKFTQNQAWYGGGIANEMFSYLSVDNTIFSNNQSGAIVTAGSSTLIISNSTFTANTAATGSAILNGGDLHISNCLFSANSTTNTDPGSYNGVLVNSGTAAISDSTFQNNTATTTSSGYGSSGGAIWNDGTLNITTTTFSGNSADRGGAIFNENWYGNPIGVLSLNGSQFSDNSAAFGGAIYNHNATISSVNASLFSGNTATGSSSGSDAAGGAIYGTSSNPITNSRFIANTSQYVGGAIYNLASPSITNCTFLKNTASDGTWGWGGAINNQGSGTTRITNSTFSGNFAKKTGGAVFTQSGANAVLRNNILWNDSSGLSGYEEIFDYAPNVRYTDIAQDGFDGNGNIYHNPDFVNVSDPDPLNWDVRLQGTSVCIDAGDNASIPSGITTDLDNRPRIIDGNGDFAAVVDMGAYEYFAPDTVPPTCAVQINSGAAATLSTSATLTLAYTLAPFMCIKNANTGPCGASEWLTYYSPDPWTLTSGDGTKTVYVWLRDAQGNVSSSPCSDSIILDTTPPANGTLIATEDNGEIILTWPDFSDGAGSGISSYKLVYSTSGPLSDCNSGTVLYTGPLTTYTHTVPPSGTVYYYRVCATDAAGLTDSGSTASGVPQGAAVKVFHNQTPVHDDTSIQAAYAAASPSDVIKTRTTSFFETLLFDTNPIIFEGGYDTTYSSIIGRATVVGSLTISGGSLTIGSGGLVLQASK
ncbi:MAG TPA: right-handed parallel beta-helix repeat-containing protein, partial [Dissulfurispiraceae bacterium]|nr:right-handed parallel beta-helix repeat-containing protein [Dissulfurispiraceae bacterium]